MEIRKIGNGEESQRALPQSLLPPLLFKKARNPNQQTFST